MFDFVFSSCDKKRLPELPVSLPAAGLIPVFSKYKTFNSLTPKYTRFGTFLQHDLAPLKKREISKKKRQKNAEKLYYDDA